jgi:hypothetical protein
MHTIMGSGISLPAQLFKKNLLRVKTKEYEPLPKEYEPLPKEYEPLPKEYEPLPKEYEPLPKEAPGIQRQNQFEWSPKIEIKNEQLSYSEAK